MRRILFGAIWLTGFLAVLLSWGMMWGRAQGEGPNLIIGVIGEQFSGCQLGIINPETGVARSGGGKFPYCRVEPIGWSPDGYWFYYSYLARSENNNYVYQLERIDKALTQSEVLAYNVFGSYDDVYAAMIPSTGELVYLQYPRGSFALNSLELYITDGDGQNRVNVTTQLQLYYGIALGFRPIISPTQTAILIYGYGGHGGTSLYWVPIKSRQPLPVPNFDDGAVILWTNSPEWLVWAEAYRSSDRSYSTYLYKMRLDGTDQTLLKILEQTQGFDGWVHESGIIGFLDGNTFNAMSVETGEILWTLDDVETIYNGLRWDSNRANLDPDWVHFRMLDGRFARCRLDGSEITFYGSATSQFVWVIWDWSPDREWVWYDTYNPNVVMGDVIRAQRDTGREEILVKNVAAGFWEWSPDGRSAYYSEGYRGEHLWRVRADGTGKPEAIVQNFDFSPLTWTPPYQAEWQPTHTLAISIGLMSFSTLTPIVLWRRRHKQRTA